MGARETQHPPAPTSVTGRREELGQEMRRVGQVGGHRRQLRAQRASEPILNSGDNLSPPAFPLGNLTPQQAKVRPLAGEQPKSLQKTTRENTGSPALTQCARTYARLS